MYEPRVGIRYDPTLTHEGRRAVIRDYAYRNGWVRNFVETGTNDAQTVIAVDDLFDHLYTIEIGRHIFEANKKLLSGYPKITALRGDSAKLLPGLLEKINAPCLFWLDGHFCGDARGDKDTPVMEELETIFKTNMKHIILIDDARLYGRDPEYPTLEWVRDIATSQDIEYDFSYANDIMRIVPV